MSRKKEYNEHHAKIVYVLAQYGVARADIAQNIDMSDVTMDRLYRKELDKGRAQGKAKLLKSAFELAPKLAEKGNTSLLIFLLKTRAGLREDAKADKEEKGTSGVLVTPGILDEESWQKESNKK